MESAEAVGAKAIAPPLGLLTVAAMLPASWDLKLVDLNVRDLRKDEWDAADIICTGGMLPQQDGILDIVRRANQDGKYVAVGGPTRRANLSFITKQMLAFSVKGKAPSHFG